MEIKICGITNLFDAICAYECGADAIGFIFYPKSQRYVTPDTVRSIINKMPPEVAKIGVFVNENEKIIHEIHTFCKLDIIQLHGDESFEYCERFPSDILIKAVSLQSEADIEKLPNYNVKAILVDARDKDLYGGTGKKSNWRLAAKVKKTQALILSGGLNIDNVIKAIEFVSPQAVDINSGIEISPGVKNHSKIRQIISLIRNTYAKSEKSVFK